MWGGEKKGDTEREQNAFGYKRLKMLNRAPF